MKTLILLLLPSVVFGQQSIYSVEMGEKLIRPGSVSIANFNGNKQRELRLQIWNKDTDQNRLVFLDPQTQKEKAVEFKIHIIYPITLRHPYEVMSGDTNGDGMIETIIIPEIDTFRPSPDEPSVGY